MPDCVKPIPFYLDGLAGTDSGNLPDRQGIAILLFRMRPPTKPVPIIE